MYAIRPNSLFGKIGLQNGDTIKSINGIDMSSPDKALEVYTKVRVAPQPLGVGRSAAASPSPWTTRSNETSRSRPSLVLLVPAVALGGRSPVEAVAQTRVRAAGHAAHAGSGRRPRARSGHARGRRRRPPPAAPRHAGARRATAGAAAAPPPRPPRPIDVARRGLRALQVPEAQGPTSAIKVDAQARHQLNRPRRLGDGLHLQAASSTGTRSPAAPPR